ncbi:MAG: protein kinase [Planctomycetota bacterium]
MSVCLGPGEIAELLAGVLSPEAKTRAEAHLGQCARCRKEFATRSEENRLFRVIQNAYELETLPDPSEADTVALEKPLPEPQPPTAETVEGYTILSEIHRGGQGVVYKAFQKAPQRTVALKLLLQGPYASSEQRRRFEREIRLVAGLHHPHIVTLYDSGVTADGRHYFAMEYIEGRSLSAYLAQNPLTVDNMLRLFQKICAAVNYAHEHGVIHRDLKPSNILIDDAGEPHVVDFGLAKTSRADLADTAPVTVTGEFVGTWAYASPEQIKGDLELIDTQTDVYALGMMLYEVLTGGRPYAVDGPWSEVLHNIAEVEPAKPFTRDRRIDGEVQTIVLKALAKEPQRRYASAGEMGGDLARYLDGLPIRAKRDRPVYIVRKRIRHATARHTLAAYIGVFVLAWALSFVSLTVRFPFRPLDRMFESGAVALRHGSPSARWSAAIAVIALNDETYPRIPELAAAENLPEVLPANYKSWRALHGALMRRVARARPKVVAWDIFFRTAEPSDARFVDGVEALHAAGAKVVVVCDTEGDPDKPLVSPAIAARVDGVGSGSMSEFGGIVRGTRLAIDQPPSPIVPSLALIAFAFYQHPDYTPRLVWWGSEPFLEVHYVQEVPDTAGGARWLGGDRVWFTRKQDMPPAEQAKGAVAGRRRDALLWTFVPSPEVLARHTVPYHEVFAADDATLREWFEGKVVMIGDNRLWTTPYPDRRLLADAAGGREEFNCYMHAAALSDLLTGATLTLWHLLWEVLTLLFVAALGLWVGIGLRRLRTRLPSWVACMLAVTLLGGLVVGVGLALVVRTGMLIRPSSVILALAVSIAGGAWVAGLSARRRGFRVWTVPVAKTRADAGT